MDMNTVSDDDLSTLKNSLRLDGTNDDAMLKSIILTARKNIVGQVGNQVANFYDENPEFDWAVILLASHLFANRSATTDQQKFETPIAFENLILSLKEDYLVQLGGKSDGQTSQSFQTEPTN